LSWYVAGLALLMAGVIVALAAILLQAGIPTGVVYSFAASAIPTAVVALLATVAVLDALVSTGRLSKHLKPSPQPSTFLRPDWIVLAGLVAGAVFGWFVWE
jgi:hypothetical protein